VSHTPAATPEIPASRYRDRQDRLAGLVEDRGFEAILVGVGPDLEYLTGYRALPLERLTMLVVARGADPFLVVPRLERAAAEAGTRVSLQVRTWEETEDPYMLALSGIPAARDREARFAVSDGLWALHLLAFQAHLADDDRFDAYAFGLASSLLGELRAIKDPDEIALLRLAAHAADRVVAAIAAGPLVGRTEADVAREVRERLIAEGHDEASFAIVASGSNAASPHHDATDRAILLAPIAIRPLRIVPRAEAIPDQARVVSRRLQRIHGDIQSWLRWNDLPRLAWEKLPIADAIQQIPDRMLQRFLERQRHAPHVAAAEPLHPQGERGGVTTLKGAPGLGAEDALDFFRAGQRHEQRLSKAQSNPAGAVDNLDRDDLRFIRANLRVPDDPIPGELHPRQAKPLDQTGYRHSRFPF